VKPTGHGEHAPPGPEGAKPAAQIGFSSAEQSMEVVFPTGVWAQDADTAGPTSPVVTSATLAFTSKQPVVG